jgi:hypothetical protein
LDDQMRCEICDRQEGPQDETAGATEGGEQVFAGDSNAPPAPEASSQAADSSEELSDERSESISAEEPAPQPQVPASPAPAAGTASSTSIDSKGEQNILEKAFQTIGDIYQTEIGGDVSSDTFHVGTRGDVYLRDIGGGNQSARDSYKTTIDGGVRGGDVQIGDRFYVPAKPEEEVSLYSLTQKLPPRDNLELHESAQVEVREKVAQLKETRLMFIACPYAEFAVDAGQVAVERLGLDNPEQNRLLNYEDVAGKNLVFTARNLLEQIPKEEAERALLVYAQSDSAQSFLDSFFDTPNRIDVIRAELRRSHLFLIVIAAPQNAQRRLGHLRRTLLFAYAEIPFLGPFLRQNFPDDYERLEVNIGDQRARGKWEKDETSFCRQILDFYHDEQLEAVVAAGGPEDPRLSAETLLEGSGLVEKNVLYAATFFQEVTLPEFSLVVEALLDGHSAAAAPPANGAKDGDAPAPARAELSPGRVWEKEKDRLFNQWLRETSVAKDSFRVVTLSNSALREPLRKLFEKQHRFYLIDQFNALQERGIFFHPSLRLAENAAMIAVRMAGAYPDRFNENWVVDLVNRVSRHFDFDSSEAPAGEEAMFRFLRGSQPWAFNLALARVAAVLRRMLESPQLRGVVQSSLEQLIKGGYHEETLLLVKQLQFAPEFDELHWLKQLLHRADNRTRHLTYYYLYAHLKRTGGGVYEWLKRIEAWLPQTDRDPGSYSQFDHFALRLLIQYCVETVARFNAKYYGDWPSRYPLLAVSDGEEAAERTSLIARWLLHPGIESTLARMKMGGTRMTLIGALLAEWAFILLGPADASPADAPAAPGENGARLADVSAEAAYDARCSPATLFDLLVWQFASRTNLSQRLELLKYWNKLNHDLLKYQVRLPTASGLRGQLSWKRELVGKLITQIKSAPAAARSLPAAYGPR